MTDKTDEGCPWCGVRGCYEDGGCDGFNDARDAASEETGGPWRDQDDPRMSIEWLRAMNVRIVSARRAGEEER